MSGLLIVGAGGHGMVVADTASETGRWENIAFVDDKYPEAKEILDWPVLGTFKEAPNFRSKYPDIIVAIGDNMLRVSLLRECAQKGFNLATLIHPRAFVSKRAKLQEGCVINAQSAINAMANIGLGSIINTGASVGYGCSLGCGVHIAPGVRLARDVLVGDYTWMGIGSLVIENIEIGKHVMAGAGSVVIRNVPDHVTIIGVPSRSILP